MNIRARASKTFLQAVLGYICTLGITDLDLGDRTVVYGVIIAALAAGLSALMNYDWSSNESIEDKKDKKDKKDKDDKEEEEVNEDN